MGFGMVVVWILLQLCTMADTKTIDEIILEAMPQESAMSKSPEGHSVRVELDILYTPEDWAVKQAMADVDPRLSRRGVIIELYGRWSDGVVPYVISPEFAVDLFSRTAIEGAISDWNTYTCLKFRPWKKGDTNYIYFIYGNGCYSYLGMQGGRQPLSLGRGCDKKGVAIHEIGHAIGFYHEHERYDRDKFIKILTENIIPGMEQNFNKYPETAQDVYGITYDYFSVMHFGPNSYSVNGKPTILTIDPSKQDIIGNREGFSFSDINLANAMYDCAAGCPVTTCPGDGFVGKDCKCWCPGIPYVLCNHGEDGGGKDGSSTSNSNVEVIEVETDGSDETKDTKKTSCRDVYDDQTCIQMRKETSFCHSSAYKKNCAFTCGLCGAGCVDRSRSCDRLASHGMCTNRVVYSYMYTNCKAACGFCLDG